MNKDDDKISQENLDSEHGSSDSSSVGGNPKRRVLKAAKPEDYDYIYLGEDEIDDGEDIQEPPPNFPPMPGMPGEYMPQVPLGAGFAAEYDLEDEDVDADEELPQPVGEGPIPKKMGRNLARVSAQGYEAGPSQRSDIDGSAEPRMICGRFSAIVRFICKAVVSALILCAFFCVCMYAYKTYYKRSLTQENVSLALKEPAAEVEALQLPKGGAREALERFYSAIGADPRAISTIDVFLNGNIDVRKKEIRNIYAIVKKSEDKMYVRIGSSGIVRAYYVDIAKNTAQRLLDGGMGGKREDVGQFRALVVRGIACFDESLLRNATAAGAEGRFAFDGEANIDGRACNVVSLDEGGGVKSRYYFERESGLLCKALYQYKSQTCEVYYSDYQRLEGGRAYPVQRRIDVNSKPFAKIKFGTAAKCQGMVFPS